MFSPFPYDGAEKEFDNCEGRFIHWVIYKLKGKLNLKADVHYIDDEFHEGVECKYNVPVNAMD